MKLSLYFFRQFIPSFFFGTALFLFVLILDRLFDLLDLIFNKGASIFVVLKLFLLFIPTILPLTFPMAIVLSSVVTFGRLSEENELTAVRSAGIPTLQVLWIPPLFALVLSIFMIPFNTRIMPWTNRMFRAAFEDLVQSEPLVNIQPKKFFAVQDLKIYAQSVDSKSKEMHNVIIYQEQTDGRPADRIFAKSGTVESDPKAIRLTLTNGQLERFDPLEPKVLLHTTFNTYQVNIPINMAANSKGTRFRNIPSPELKTLIHDLKRKGFNTHPLEAEYSLRYAMACAPVCLGIMAIPLATSLKKGGRSFGFGITIILIFAYYLMLIFGLTLAEKGVLPAPLSLWIGNFICLVLGSFLFYRLHKQ